MTQMFLTFASGITENKAISFPLCEAACQRWAPSMVSSLSLLYPRADIPAPRTIFHVMFFKTPSRSDPSNLPDLESSDPSS